MNDAVPISETLDAARTYLRAGLSVIPVKADGSKSPRYSGWRAYAEQQPTNDEIWDWWGPDAREILGIGIPGGPASGNLAVLDLETASVFDQWLASIPSDTIDWLDECPLARTPRTGAHLYCRLPEPVPGTVLAQHVVDGKVKTLIEVRGDGHQVLAPGCPLCCHETLKPYLWERRGWIDGGFRSPIPFDIWFDWADRAAALNQYTPPVTIRPQSAPQDRDPARPRPGDDFNFRGTWEETGLFGCGWKWEREFDFDCGYIRRPGATHKSGTLSMVTSKKNGWPLFYCFTSSADHFHQDQSYDRFGVYARINHKGDLKAAARELAAKGYGDQTPYRLADRRKSQGELPVSSSGSSPPVIPIKPEKKSAFKFVDVVDFLKEDHKPRWLVPGILVRGQPGVIAAPSKGMKTSILLDLAVSMATGTAFLGKFKVNDRVRVAVASGESGEHTIKETILRILKSKGFDDFPDRECLNLEFRLPIFTDDILMTDFADHLARLDAEVIVIDPTYLALGEVDARNIFEMGKALRRIGEHLAKHRPDVTVILVHHANRLLPVGEAMELQHLAYSGLEQFARQFFLMNRKEPFKSDGKHSIWLRVGGSAGHGGMWNIQIDEGILNEDFSGRKWDVGVFSLNETASAAVIEKDSSSKSRRLNEMRLSEDTVLVVIDAEIVKGNKGATMNKIREKTSYSFGKSRDVINRLLERGSIVEVDIPVPIGAGSSRSVKGYCRSDDSLSVDDDEYESTG